MVCINSSSLLFDRPLTKPVEETSEQTVYPSLSSSINPQFYGNDGLQSYSILGSDGETVIGHEPFLLNVRPQVSSFHGVYDWRWDAEHSPEARSIAAQLSMTHNGPQRLVVDRYGLWKIVPLGGYRVGKCFVGGMERNIIEDQKQAAEAVAVLRRKYDEDDELIDYREKWESVIGRPLKGLRSITDITSQGLWDKPLDEVQLFLAEGDPSTNEEELLAAEQAADKVEEMLNLDRRRELARRELSALAKRAKSIPKMFKGRKSWLWSEAWQRFYRRRDQLKSQGLISDPIDVRQAAQYRKNGAYIYYSLVAARRFASLASRIGSVSTRNRNVIITRQQKTGHYYCLVNIASKDPKNEVETWFAGRPTPSPYRRGDFKRDYSAVLRWVGGDKPESSYLERTPADAKDSAPSRKSKFDHVFGTSFGNRWLDDEHLEVRKLPIGKGGFWSDFRAVTDEEAEMLLQMFFGHMDFHTGIDSMVVQAVADDNERSGEDLVGGYEATNYSEDLGGEDNARTYAWHEREFDAEMEDYR